MACVVCEEHGAERLCHNCSQMVPAYDGQIPEHVESDVGEPAAWLVDALGGVHAVGSRTTIGRRGAQLSILRKTVSTRHAEIVRDGTTWYLHDLKSRNGTFAHGREVRRERVEIDKRTPIRFGDVAFWFLTNVAPEHRGVAGAHSTDELVTTVRYFLHPSGVDLFLFGDTHGDRRVLMSRPRSSIGWGKERRLSPQEFHLLRILCARRLEDAGAPVHGVVPMQRLVAELPHQTENPDEGNVRHAVMRARRKLADAGGGGILDSSLGEGYFLTCPVTLDAVRPPGA